MSTTVLGLTNDYATANTVTAAQLNSIGNNLEYAFATRTSLSVAGAVNVTLSTAQASALVIELTGVLTGNIQVIFPQWAGKPWQVYNATTGAFTLTAITASGTGVLLRQGTRGAVYFDGTNVVRQGAEFSATGDLSPQNLAAASVLGGIPLVRYINVPAGTTGDVDTTITHKERVIDAWLVKTNAAGGGAGTIQIKNGAAAITDAMSINVADQTRVEPTTIDDAAWEIAAGGTLRITRTRSASTDETCVVYVTSLRVA